MLGMMFPESTDPLNVLCLGAHCDDIEIGCGGTLLELTRSRAVNCTWVVFCSNDIRSKEAQNCAESFLSDATCRDIRINSFRDGFLPYSAVQVKEYFESLKNIVNPDLIFTHYRNDKHQDHRFLAELALNTYRDHLILEYEIPKYDGDLGQPNLHIPISQELVHDKVEAIYNYYVSQQGKKWFDTGLFRSLMRIRGMETNSPSDYAESFYIHKAVLSIRN